PPLLGSLSLPPPPSNGCQPVFVAPRIASPGPGPGPSRSPGKNPLMGGCLSCRLLSGVGLLGAGGYVYWTARRPLKLGCAPTPGTIFQMVVGIITFESGSGPLRSLAGLLGLGVQHLWSTPGRRLQTQGVTCPKSHRKHCVLGVGHIGGPCRKSPSHRIKEAMMVMMVMMMMMMMMMKLAASTTQP
uniref:Transmembrane protein 261 n=1 Tax=Phascolarctos cinereus TaxID=38626 RepID=A0A6P5LTY3_PHACI